mmetsp:Transcript_9676/g.25040  ORF Transcript_9676/g.25040 Transcript_9676/m.25040 type:complete len:358 (-) Transcript_9676:58-1131(-)
MQCCQFSSGTSTSAPARPHGPQPCLVGGQPCLVGGGSGSASGGGACASFPPPPAGLQPQPQPQLMQPPQQLAAGAVPTSMSTSMSAVAPPQRGPGPGGLDAGRSAAEIPAHMLLGVSLPYMREFARRHGYDADTPSHLVRELVLELTAPTLRSMAECLVEDRTKGGLPAVGIATLFVSHAHACSYHRMVDAVEAHFELHELDLARTFVWLDIFSVRQHSVDTEIGLIGLVEQRIGRVVMVLDPWDKPVCLTRVWCLFELVHSLQPSVELDLTVPAAERARFVNALHQDPGAMQAMLTNFDARNASASGDADREAILMVIAHYFGGILEDDDDGLEYFNQETRMAIRDALAGMSWSIM